jgi:hypothetical protein
MGHNILRAFVSFVESKEAARLITGITGPVGSWRLLAIAGCQVWLRAASDPRRSSSFGRVTF